MTKGVARRKNSFVNRLGLALMPACFITAAVAVEPEKQPIYSNTPGGLLCGTTSATACKVPAGQRLIIEYVSGYAFLPPSSAQATSVTMTVKDPQLGLNGAGFHVFPAIKVNTTPNNDVFAFSVPLKMMLHPNATFYFQPAAGIAVSGYLVSGN